jgi:calcineurin-like phosphoesterase family protein
LRRLWILIAVLIALVVPRSAGATNLTYDQVRSIVQNPASADVERFALTDSRGYPMNHLKVIKNLTPAADNRDRYIGVYDASLLGPTAPPEPMVAVSPDLVTWTWKINLLRYTGGVSGREPYIANAPDPSGNPTGGYLLAYELEDLAGPPHCSYFGSDPPQVIPGNGAPRCLRFFYYRDLISLLRGRVLRDVVVPMKLSPCFEGTPSIENVSGNVYSGPFTIDYRAHFSSGCSTDMQGRGTITSWNPDTSNSLNPTPEVDTALNAAMAPANHRDRDRYEATDFYLYEAAGASGSQIYSYNAATLSAQRIDIKTSLTGGSTSFTSPTITRITDPAGDEAVLVTVNIPSSTVPGEVGELLYYRKIHPNLPTPTRGAFYYPWFPETWSPPSGQTDNPWTKFTPSLCSSPTSCANYDSSSQTIVDGHIAALDYGKFGLGIASWFGPQSQTGGSHNENTRIPLVLDQTQKKSRTLKWALYYECEGTANGCPNGPDPTSSQIQSDLSYVMNTAKYTDHLNYAYKDGKPVIFVYAANDQGCTAPGNVIERWSQFFSDWYVVMKVLDNTDWRSCSPQPGSWHQYAPAKATDNQSAYSFAISPGYDKQGETQQCAVGVPCSTLGNANCTTAGSTCRPYLRRDLHRFEQNVCTMNSKTTYAFHLVTSFNEWGEGHAVESAAEWTDGTQGRYLNVLANPTCSAPSPVVAAVGDISCSAASTGWNGGAGDSTHCHDQQTLNAALGMKPDLVLGLGDLQYEGGAITDYNSYYQPSWGQVKAVTLPVPGNHEYGTSGAGGYFDYFDNGGKDDLYTAAGDQNAPTGQAGERGRGWYFYDLDSNSDGVADWRLIALNSSTGNGGGINQDNDGCITVLCAVGSEQELWLRNVALAADRPNCVLAFWHHPRYGSSLRHRGSRNVSPLWMALNAAHADLVLNGHNHSYERFAKLRDDISGWNNGADNIPGNADDDQNADSGVIDSTFGMRQFTVGSGGKDHDGAFTATRTGSEAINYSDFGILKLALNPSSYEWKFVKEDGTTILDQGPASENCNG